MALNKVMLIGNVGAEPEVRYLEGNAGGQGRKVATFRLATSERYRDRDGNLRENTEWHSIVAWGQSADVVERFVHKGTQLYVEGRLRTRQWTDQSQNKRYTTEINVDSLQLLGRREQEAPQSEYRGSGYPFGAPAEPRQGGQYEGPGHQYNAPQNGYQSSQPGYQGGYQSTQQGGYPSPQQGGSYQAPRQGGYQAPQNTPAPAPAAPANMDEGNDDLPF